MRWGDARAYGIGSVPDGAIAGGADVFLGVILLGWWVGMSASTMSVAAASQCCRAGGRRRSSFASASQGESVEGQTRATNQF